MSDRARLFWLSFLMLFLEIALIRWTGSNTIYLSYFSNFVLMGSFLGIGIGFLRGSKARDLFPWAPWMLLALVGFIERYPVKIDRSGSDLIFFGSFETTGLPVWITLPVIFVVVAAVMMGVAQGVAQTFRKLPALEAYRFDILGSIFGVTAYAVISFLGAAPVAWGVIVALAFLVGYGRRVRVHSMIAVVALVVVLAFESSAPDDLWSPYYKISLLGGAPGTYPVTVLVNGIPHQAILPIGDRIKGEPVYVAAYDRIRNNPLQDILVVGAGNGTDVAIALNKGARHVDAVEIDPRLYQLGRDLHPDRPYQDPRVDVHIDDGRAFLERTDDLYDLIVFALPDSLTLVSGQSSLRLESYLFTLEAMETAREHLKPTGAFTMYNFYRERWLIERLANTLAETYGYQPCLDNFNEASVLVAATIAKDPAYLDCPNAATPLAAAPEPATDDWPFLYLISRRIPSTYLLAVGLILAFSLVMVRSFSGRFSAMSPYKDLFFMGVAFLLLETKSVVRFALLFGTTWLVNAIVFIGILLAVLVAIEVARRVTIRRPQRLYAILVISLVLAWLVPENRLLSLDLIPRMGAAILLTFTPIFLANLVFAHRFKNVSETATAFGANLLGAMVGGALEYTALIVGYRALLIVVALLYGLAFWTGRRHLGDAGSPSIAHG